VDPKAKISVPNEDRPELVDINKISVPNEDRPELVDTKNPQVPAAFNSDQEIGSAKAVATSTLLGARSVTDAERHAQKEV